MTEPIHAVLRKINGGNRMDGTAGWVYVTLFPDVLTTPAEWVPADNSGSPTFRLAAYADTVPLDMDDNDDRCECLQMMGSARWNLLDALLDGAFAHNPVEVDARPMVFCHEWKDGENE